MRPGMMRRFAPIVLACSAFLLIPGLLGAQSESGVGSPAPPASSVSVEPEKLAPPPPPDLTPDANGMLSQQQMEKLLRVAAEKDIENDKKQLDYTYIERSEEHRLDGKGQVKSTESKTSEVLMIYGEQVERLIAKNDKPLSEKDAAKEEAKIQKVIDKRRNESDGDRKKRLAKEEKEREDGRQFVREVADAYNFRLVGTESLNGRDAYAIDADPRPGYEPHRKEAKFLPKIRGRIWIDKEENQWVKLDARVIDTVSFGLFLARLHKGTCIMVEAMRVNDEVWLPKRVTAKVDVRVALLKNFNVDEDVTYRDYKKFRTGTKIVGVAEEVK
jgi:hypothetical protein